MPTGSSILVRHLRTLMMRLGRLMSRQHLHLRRTDDTAVPNAAGRYRIAGFADNRKSQAGTNS